MANTPLNIVNLRLSMATVANWWAKDGLGGAGEVMSMLGLDLGVSESPSHPDPTVTLSPPVPLRRQKSSFLPSYIIDVRELDEKLLNIIDMQFLCGYYEPTLLILFEPNQTWPG